MYGGGGGGERGGGVDDGLATLYTYFNTLATVHFVLTYRTDKGSSVDLIIFVAFVL